MFRKIKLTGNICRYSGIVWNACPVQLRLKGQSQVLDSIDVSTCQNALLFSGVDEAKKTLVYFFE